MSGEMQLGPEVCSQPPRLCSRGAGSWCRAAGGAHCCGRLKGGSWARPRKSVCLHLGYIFISAHCRDDLSSLVLHLTTYDRETPVLAWCKVFIVLENSVSAKYLEIWCVILILKDRKSLVGASKSSITVRQCSQDSKDPFSWEKKSICTNRLCSGLGMGPSGLMLANVVPATLIHFWLDWTHWNLFQCINSELLNVCTVYDN